MDGCTVYLSIFSSDILIRSYLLCSSGLLSSKLASHQSLQEQVQFYLLNIYYFIPSNIHKYPFKGYNSTQVRRKVQCSVVKLVYRWEDAWHGWLDSSSSIYSRPVCFYGSSSGPWSQQAIVDSTVSPYLWLSALMYLSALFRPQSSPSQPRPQPRPLALTPLPLHPLCSKLSPAGSLTTSFPFIHLFLSPSDSVCVNFSCSPSHPVAQSAMSMR